MKYFISILVGFMSLPLTVFGQSEVGMASFYHNKFEGRRTSSGEVFHQAEMTCAHKTLPFGTRIKVTNLDNDSTVVVKVNDRLPKHSRRSVDLTRSAAKKLNFIPKGLTKVQIEVLPATDPTKDGL
jgi:rare lipoprotein A